MNYFLITLLALLASVLILLVLTKFLPHKGNQDISEEEEE